MAHRVSGIVPLLFITLFCVGCVEGGYRALEYFLLKGLTGKVIVAEQPPVQIVRKAEMVQQKHEYTVILKRNLFGPPPAAKKNEVKVKDPAEDLETTTLKIVLKGTIDGEGGSKRAIILDKKSKNQELFQKGDGIQGAFVKEILRGKVILSYNGRDEVLVMSDTAGKAEPAGPVAVAPGTVGKGVIPGSRPVIRKKPARRVVKPRVIRPAKPAAEG